MKNQNRQWRGWVVGGLSFLVLGWWLATVNAAQVPQSHGDRSQEEGLLIASGTIQAREIRIGTEVGGRILEVRAEEGSKVQAGEVLVILDATPFFAQLAIAEAAIASAEAQLALVEAAPRVEEVAALQAALSLAHAQADGAHAGWQNALEAIEDPQEIDAQITEANTQLALARQAVELAEAELAREMLLRDQREGFEREVADLQVRAAEEALLAAQADELAVQRLLYWLWVIRNEPLHLIAQAHAAEGTYHGAASGVTVTQAQLDDLLAGPSREELAVAEAAVRQAQADAEVIRVQVDLCTIVSPIDGVLLSQILRVGELVPPAATILTVADLEEVELVVFVPENRIGEVKLSQTVDVVVDSFPDRVFHGRVAHIANEPEFTPRNVVTVEERLNTFYAVDILLFNADRALKPGMPADASFAPIP